MALAARRAVQIAIRTISHVDALPEIAKSWAALQDISPDASVFSTWQWNAAAARHFCEPDGVRIMLLQDGDEPVALAPLAKRRILGMKGLVFLGAGKSDYARADYQDFLVAPGWEHQAGEAFTDYLASIQQDWDVVMLQELPQSSRVAGLLPAMARVAGWRVRVDPDDDIYRVRLPKTWDEYTASLTPNVRNNFLRKLRKLEREHSASYERVNNPAELDAAMQCLFDLHNHRWEEKHGGKALPTIFSDDAVNDFHREVAANLFWGGMLDLRLLKADDETVGARYSFDFKGTRAFYASGYRPDGEWAKFSLGAVMDFQSIRDSIAQGFEYEDLLRNEGEYKARYEVERCDNQRLLIFRTRSAELRYVAYRELRRQAKRLLRRE